MTTYRPADIILVPFPFTDLATVKKRPALILTLIQPRKLPPLLITAMITSKLDAETIQGDWILKGWQKYGLLHPSKVRLAKVVPIEKNIIIDKLGSVSPAEWKEIRREFLALF